MDNDCDGVVDPDNALDATIWYFDADQDGDDDLYVFFPSANYFATSIKDGVFPFWLPGLRSGIPFYSDIQMGVFYPLKWVLVAFVQDGMLSQQAYQNYLVFQYFIGGVLFFRLMRMHGLCRSSALAGSMVFLFSGFAALHIIFFSSVEVVLLMPLVLIAIKHYFARKSLSRVLLISLAVLLTFLPGFPQITLYMSYFSIAYWLILALYDELDRQNDWKRIGLSLVRELFIIAATFIAALIMGAIVFLPAFENWQYSHRADFGYEEIADTSMPFYYLVHLFFPNFTGVMQPTGNEVQYWGFNRDTLGFERYNTGYWQYWALSCYAGQIGIIAFLYSVVFIRALWKSSFRLACTLGAVFALWFILGRYGGLYRVLYEVLPGISAFRGPGRMSSVFNTAQAVLVVFFVRDIIQGESIARIRRFLLVVGGLYLLFLVAFVVYGKNACALYEHAELYRFSLRQLGVGIAFTAVIILVTQLIWRPRLQKYNGVLVGILLLSIFVDLFMAHGGFHKGDVSVQDYFGDKHGLVSQFQKYTRQNGPCRFGQVANGRLNESVVMPRNMGYIHDIEFPEGYVLFRTAADSRMRKNLPTDALLDLLNIGVVAERTPKGVQVRVHPTALPRASLYGRIAKYDSYDELFEAVSSKTMDYRNQVAVLRSDVGELVFDSDRPRTACISKKITNNRWHITCPSSDPGIIVVSQMYYPGWTAMTPDGVHYQVIETFGGLTGILLPEGSSGDIDFRFRPRIFFMGLTVSAVSFSAVVVILLGGAMRRRNGKRRSD